MKSSQIAWWQKDWVHCYLTKAKSFPSLPKPMRFLNIWYLHAQRKGIFPLLCTLCFVFWVFLRKARFTLLLLSKINYSYLITSGHICGIILVRFSFTNACIPPPSKGVSQVITVYHQASLPRAVGIPLRTLNFSPIAFTPQLAHRSKNSNDTKPPSGAHTTHRVNTVRFESLEGPCWTTRLETRFWLLASQKWNV